MSSPMTSKNLFAVLEDEQLEAKFASALDLNKDVTSNDSASDDFEQEITKPAKPQPTRLFGKLQQLHYEERQIARAEKAKREAAEKKKEENVAEKKRKQALPAAAAPPKTVTVTKDGVTKTYTQKQVEAYEARKASREQYKQQKKQRKAEFEERVARRAANQAAFEERQAKRAADQAAYEARCARREGKAAFEEREAKRQARAKQAWNVECLRTRACFNCGSQEHKSGDCPEPPYEGKY